MNFILTSIHPNLRFKKMIVSFRVSQNLFQCFLFPFVNDFVSLKSFTNSNVNIHSKLFLTLSTVLLFWFFTSMISILCYKNLPTKIDRVVISLLSGRLCKRIWFFSPQRNKSVSKSRTEANRKKELFYNFKTGTKTYSFSFFLSFFFNLPLITWLLMIIRENTRWICRMNWFTNLSFNYKVWIYWLFNTYSVFATLSISNFAWLHFFSCDDAHENVIMLYDVCKHQ